MFGSPVPGPALKAVERQGVGPDGGSPSPEASPGGCAAPGPGLLCLLLTLRHVSKLPNTAYFCHQRQATPTATPTATPFPHTSKGIEILLRQ